jgi:hypothetical protein
MPGRLRRRDARSATPAAHCSRSRGATRQPGGTAPIRSVNVLRGQSGFTHFSRFFTQFRSTGSPALRTSFGRVTTTSCTRDDSAPQSGHAAAPPRSVTAHTSTAPPAPGSASVTRSPGTPNSADAVSWNTMPAVLY